MTFSWIFNNTPPPVRTATRSSEIVERLLSRAKSLATEFEQTGERSHIDKAIDLSREALELCAPGRSMRSLTWLSTHLKARYNQFGGMDDLSEAINLSRHALTLCPPGHPDRSMSLGNLAIHLNARHNEFGGMDDLNEATLLTREALALRPPGHPYRLTSLSSLASYLSDLYKEFGGSDNLDEAIVLSREALALCPQRHLDRSMSLSNLASYLSDRYLKQLGGLDNLDEAIVLSREALTLCPQGHPDRSMSLSTLASYLSDRYKQLGELDNFDEVIVLSREALALCPPGHPDRSSLFRGLASRLSDRYERLGELDDLDEAIVLSREALAHLSLGHPDQSSSLSNLATFLSDRYKRLWRTEDLDEAITHGRGALQFCPTGHVDRSICLNDLAVDLFTRYIQLGALEDLDEAIILVNDALLLHPPGHPFRLSSLDNLACYLHVRFALSNLPKDKEQLFGLYAQMEDVTGPVSFTDLFAGRAWIRVAEIFQHPTTLLAYETSLRLLLCHLTTLPSLPQQLDVLENFTSSLAVEGFSACLRNHFPTKAVEFLEQGLGLFWSQLARFHSPVDDFIASGPEGEKLADKFTQLISLIRNTADQHDRIYRLNMELQRVVTDIRELPGLSRFLLPTLFSQSDLQQATSGGPVIIVNASKYGCDALIVSLDRDPVHIPLQITREDVRKLALEFHTWTTRARSMDATRHLVIVLRQLWEMVVSPVVGLLQMIHLSQSRIWWCPIAEFSILPLHAAGPYRSGQQNLADLYISSYTPTLTALIRARQHEPADPAILEKRFVAIGPATEESEIHSASAELAGIGQRVDEIAAFTHVEGSECHIARVAEELSRSQWVHLACLGLPNQKQPFESAFALDDGHLTIEHIIRCELLDAQFAFLSAGHAVARQEENPNEVTHLTAAMQMAGFRSIIGTMGPVDASETAKIASTFYDYMIDGSGRLDHTRAAYALHRTMQTSVDIPFEQWINYIHLGA